MSTETYFTQLPVREASLTQPNKAAIAQFQNTLNTCVSEWHNGKATIVLEDNINELFGDLLCKYFVRSLTEQVGMPVALNFLNMGNSNRTIVEMPQKDTVIPSAELKVNAKASQTESPVCTATNMDALTTGPKKAPRPMNCWIIFRDSMHRKLKAEYPHLTVQEISTRCSQIWHALSPSEKEPWQIAAKSAKEEHLRQHPDYKYSPRKPGEKKKRQTRKAKRSAVNATRADQLSFQGASNALMQIPVITTQPAPATTTNSADFDNIFFDNPLIADPIEFFGLLPQDLALNDFVHDSESYRHSRLETEFAFDLGIELPIDLMGDETFAFRAGADDGATLPSIFTDTF